MKRTSFNYNKLIEAREFRKLSQSKLKDLLGVSRATMVAYEKGEWEPKVDMIEKIAKTLNFPYEFFFQEDYLEYNNEKELFFRAFVTANLTEKKNQKWRYYWSIEILNLLSKYFDITKTNIPEDIFLDKDFSSITNDDIELSAQKLRRHWGLGINPIINLSVLLENNGIFISKFSDNTDKIDAYSSWDNDLRNALIFSSKDKNYFRTRFNLAHELGHIIMHREIDPKNLSKDDIKDIENQAHRFSGAFHIPAQVFTNGFYYPTLDEFKRLKKRWGISIAALIMRAKDLGYINENTKQKLFINYYKRGYKKVEPLDNEYTVEEPQFFSKTIKYLIDEKFLSVLDIKNSLPLPEDELYNLINIKLNCYQQMNKLSLPKIKKNTNENLKIYNIGEN